MNAVLWAPPETDFLLLAKRGYGFIRSLEKPYVHDQVGGSHGGDPRHSYLKAGFIAAGRGINNRKLKSMHITDVAHQISELLGLGLE